MARWRTDSGTSAAVPDISPVARLAWHLAISSKSVPSFSALSRAVSSNSTNRVRSSGLSFSANRSHIIRAASCRWAADERPCRSTTDIPRLIASFRSLGSPLSRNRWCSAFATYHWRSIQSGSSLRRLSTALITSSNEGSSSFDGISST